MSVLSDYLGGVADAIREKTGGTEPIPAVKFPEAIRSIGDQQWQPHWHWADGTRIDLYDADGAIPDNTIRLLVDTRHGLRTYAFWIECPGGYKVTWGGDGSEDYTSGTTCQHTFSLDYPEEYAIVEFKPQSGANQMTGFRVAAHSRYLYGQVHAILWAVFHAPLETMDGFFFRDEDDYEVTCCHLEACDLGGVKSFGDTAFRECTALREVVIPGSMTSVKDPSFGTCRALQTVVISEGVESSGDYAFDSCSTLREIVIPGSVTGIGYGAFNECYALREIVIPGSVTSIGDEAFNACYALQIVTMSDGLESIGYGAFNSCYALREIVIPGSVTSIRDSTFGGCYALWNAVYTGTFETAVDGEYLFEYCELLTRLDWPGAKFVSFGCYGEDGRLNRLGSEGNIEGYDSPLRLDWDNCTWARAYGPHLNISYCMLSSA